jgi:uncharacterized repeat protein (TIGR01451 family)
MILRALLWSQILWFSSIIDLRAQTGHLFAITNTWRYQQTTNFDGVNWFAPGFADSSWPGGRALLYVENNSAVTLRNTLLTIGRTTYYFRTRFQFTNEPRGIGLVFSNRIDDGAVFYLNGTEIHRVRMPAAPQPIHYATPATAFPNPPLGDAVSNEVFMISGDVLTNLVVGTNVLAVEVHQQTPTSTDIVFGTSLSYVRSTGIFTFLQEPADTNILDGRPLQMSVATSITPPPALQWFKNGEALAGETLSTLTFPAVSLGDSGTYWLVASNATMVLTTRQAIVVVEPDATPPAVLSAIAQKNLTNVVIEMSEPVRPEAANPASFQLFEAGTSVPGPVVLAASISNGTTIHLTTTPRPERVNFEVRLTNIFDLSSLSNQVSSSPVLLKYVFELLRLDNSMWRFDQSGLEPPPGWHERLFDDGWWQEGPSLFYERFGAAFPHGPIGTRLETTNVVRTWPVISYYFRTWADLPGFSSNALALRHVIDDGAALYLNGELFYTIRITPPLTSTSLAEPNGGTPFFAPPTNQPPLIVPHLAQPGRNLIAAEVHQSGTNWSGDAAFGLSIEALIDEFAPALELNAPVLATNGSVMPSAGRIGIPKALPTNLVVGLTSSPPSIVSVPATVIVPAGETNATFDIAVAEAAGPIGPRRVELHAFAPAFVPAADQITAVDQAPITLSITLPSAIMEGSPSPTGQITFNTPVPIDTVIRLTTSDRDVLFVPPIVIMPAGQTATSFETILANNTVLDGARNVTVTIHVPGWTNGVFDMQVLDRSDSYRALGLSTRDLAYDPVTARIYASVPGTSASNSHRIAAIDPLTRSIEPGFAIGQEPGKLIVPPSGGSLFAAVETNRVLRRLNLLSGTTELSFALETNGGNWTIADFELLPGSPHPLAVLRLQNGVNADVAVYNEGIRRPNVAPASGDGYQEFIEAGTDGAVYFQSWGFAGFRRFTVDPSGVSADYVDSTLTPGQWTRTWRAVDDRLFGSDGIVINPLLPQVIDTIPGLPVNSLICPDAELGLVFYLSPTGTNWLLRAYEADSLAPAGMVALSGVSGTPSSLIRWGENGLAFRTDASQVFLVRTSLISTNPPADVALSLALTPPPYFVSNEITATLVITNHGPNSASDVSWTNILPAGAIVSSAQASAGSVFVNANIVRGTVTELNAQTSLTVVVTFQPVSADVMPVMASVGSVARDTNLGNNSAVSPIWVRRMDPGADEILNLSVKDIARDPVRTRLYFSVGSSASLFPNSILVMDHAEGTFAFLPMNGDPGRLAVSADGNFLYVALDSIASVRRLSLPDLSVDLGIFFDGMRPVRDIAVCPSNSHLIAVWRQFDNTYTVYDHGLALPGGSAACFDMVGFFGDKVVDGIYYDNNGMIFDVVSRQFHATLPIPFNSLIEPDLAVNRIYTLAPANGVPGWAIRAFDGNQFSEVGYYFATLDSPSSLLRWGMNGFVFRTATQVHLLRSALVPTNPPTDLALHATVSASSASPGAAIQYSFVVTNAGANASFGTVLTQAFSLAVTGVVATADAGAVANDGNFITWQIPSLPPGGSYALAVSLHAVQPGTLASRAAVRHSANDPVLNNNLAINVTRIGEPSTNEIREIGLATRELVFDPVRQKIYASIPAHEPFIGNSVIAIDPVAMRIEPLSFAGSEPNQLALSDDGHFLYVSLDGTMGARRIDLTEQQSALTFPFSWNAQFNAFDLTVQPGHPETLAASLVDIRTSGDYPAGVFIFDEGIARSSAAGVTKSIEFSPDGQRIYGSITFGAGFGFLRLAVTASGVSEIDRTGAFSQDYDLEMQNGLLYSGLGRVIDPTIPTLVATFGVNGPVEPDARLNRIFQVPLSDTGTELRAYSMETYQLLGTMLLPTARPYARNLIRCGGDRLAFRTDNGGQVFLLRTSLAVSDNDRDGMPDDWEIEFFQSAHAPDTGPEQDLDGDGVSNLNEYLIGSDPTDSLNQLRIKEVSAVDGFVVLKFHGAMGVRYQLEPASALDGPWMSVGQVMTGDGRHLMVSHDTQGAPVLFYRVRRVP